MNALPDYVLDEAAQINEDGQQLAKTRATVAAWERRLAEIEAELNKLKPALEGAYRTQDALAASLPLRREALLLLCQAHDWRLPDLSSEQPIEHLARAATTTTKANPLPPLTEEPDRRAVPLHGDHRTCENCGCEIGIGATNTYIHEATGHELCDAPLPPTVPDPAGVHPILGAPAGGAS